MSDFQYNKTKIYLIIGQNCYIITLLGLSMLTKLDRKSIGTEIRLARKAKKLSQFELAELTGLDEKQIYRIETGLTSPKLENFIKIAEVLDISIKHCELINSDVHPYCKEILNMILNISEEKLEIYYRVIRSLYGNI